MKLNENVAKLLNEQIWYLATCSDEPNAVPVAFKAVAEDGTLTVGDVFLETTLKNIEANGKIAVSACDPASMEGYQIKGTAVYTTEGPSSTPTKSWYPTCLKAPPLPRALSSSPRRPLS